MSFPTFRSIKETIVLGSSPYSIAMPDETVDPGDLLLMILSGANQENFNTPAGWTFVAGATLSIMGMAVFGKRATGSEGGTSVSVSRTGDGNVTAQVYRYSDVNGSTVGDCVFASSPAGSTAPTTNMNPSAVSPGVGAQDFTFMAVAGHTAGTTSGYPSGYSGGISTSASGMRTASCRRNLNASSEDPGSITKSSFTGGWIAYALAVRGIGFVLETKAVSGASTNSGALASSVAITKSVSGSSGNSGGVSTNVFTVISQLLEGVSTSAGDVARQALHMVGVSGASDSAGALLKKVKLSLSGTCSSVGGLVVSVSRFFRFALDDQDPSVDGTVKYLVEMSDSSMPSGVPADNALYRRALRRVPEFEKSTGNVRVGLSGLSSVNLVLSNIDKAFNSVDLEGFFVRIFRVLGSRVVEFQGVVTEWVLGSDVEVTVEDREAVAFNDQLPKRILTKELFPNIPDKNIGLALPVVHNRARNIPLRIIGIDESSRNWDYACGEGIGKFGYWQDVFTVYFKDAALGDNTGEVQSAAGANVTLESNDANPVGFYKYWWLQILDPVTGDVLDEIDVTAHTSEQTVTLSRSPAVSASGKDYRIKEWRFYDGSQSSPYPGVAFIRLKKALGNSNELDTLFADVDALPADNVVREIEDWLENSTWGLGLSINQSDFDSVASDSEISNIKTEWGVFDKADSGDIIESLLDIRGMGLLKNDTTLSIEVDDEKTSAGTFGYGDGVYDNIISIEGGGLRSVHVNDKVRNLAIQYRRNYKENGVYIGNQEAPANPTGVDETIQAAQFYAHESANRYLYYKIKKLISAAKRLTIVVGEEGEPLRARDRITVKIPHLGIDSDFLIARTRRGNGRYTLELNPYDADTYTWSKLGDYPDEPATGIPPNFEKTHPEAVSGLTVSGSAVLSETGNRSGVLEISWTPPNNGNYLDAEVFVKKSSEGTASYKSRGFGFDSLRVDGLEANTTYDVLVESRNQYGLKGLAGVVSTGNATGSATSAPSKPAKPTVDRTGRAWVFRVDPNDSAEKISHYIWEVATSAGSTQETYDNAGTQVSFSRGNSTSGTFKARVKAVNIYGQESAWSNYSANSTMEQWDTGHMSDSSIDVNKRIPVYSTTRSRSSLSISAGGNAVWIDTISHNLGRQVVASIETTSGMLSGPMVVVVTFSAIDNNTLSIRTTVYNYGGTTQSGQSYTHVVKYW